MASQCSSPEQPLIRIEPGTKIKVSSVLNRDVKQFGKQFMFDGNEETCWNSDQGSPQYVSVELPRPAVVSELQVRFQGGFVGRECVLLTTTTSKQGGGGGGGWAVQLACFFPEDDNTLQSFPVSSTEGYKVYRLEFKSSTDFFGRITVYSLQLLGTWTPL